MAWYLISKPWVRSTLRWARYIRATVRHSPMNAITSASATPNHRPCVVVLVSSAVTLSVIFTIIIIKMTKWLNYDSFFGNKYALYLERILDSVAKQ